MSKSSLGFFLATNFGMRDLDQGLDIPKIFFMWLHSKSAVGQMLNGNIFAFAISVCLFV